MESEIRLCGRIVFRLPTNKLFRKVKNIKMIFNLTPYRDQKVEDENEMKKFITMFFLSDFTLPEKRSELIWNLCLANGLSPIIPTESIYKHLPSEQSKLKFIMFFRGMKYDKSFFGKINISCIGRIIDDNFRDEKLFWWLKKLEVPKKIVFDILNVYPMCSRHTLRTPLNYMKIYETIKKIDESFLF